MGIEYDSKCTALLQAAPADKAKTDAENDAIALPWFLSAAHLGNAVAQYHLFWVYIMGKAGVTKDKKEAVKWLHKAADGKWIYALEMLSREYGYANNIRLRDHYKKLADAERILQNKPH